MSTVLQLGRNGDIINLLALAYHDFQKGDKWNLIVSAEYATLLEGTTYVTISPFNGSPMELSRAVDFAKEIDPNFLCAQVVGDRETVLREAYAKAGIDINAQYCESFAKEQWRLIGRLAEWKNQYPLVFDNRNPHREASLCDKLPQTKKGWILVALGGVTSPFQYSKILIEMLRLKFGRWYEIVDLSQIRAERLYDFLGVYEHPKTKCLVAADSALLQLAYACPSLPVAALTQDQPSLWHGSPHRPQYIAHVRYGDFPNRSLDILEAINNIGKEGSYFSPVKGNKIVHIWSEYEVNETNKSRHEKALESWASEGIVSQPFEVGSWGRDSKVKWPEEKYRYPFVKDVIRTAAMRCNDEDCIIITRPDTHLNRVNEHPPLPAFSKRVSEGTDRPQIDLFAFTRAWWEEHGKKLPDFIMGTEQNWCRGLALLIEHNGGREVPGLCYREPSPPIEYVNSPYRSYNEELLFQFARSLGLATSKPPVVEQAKCTIINSSSLFPHGYNPSMVRYDGKLLMCYRSHRTGNYSTQLAIAELDEQLNVLNNGWLDFDVANSIEDGRFFVRGNELWLAYIESHYPNNLPTCVVRYGQVVKRGGEWKLINSFQPEYYGNDHSSLVKNWCPIVNGNAIFFIYGIANGEQIALEVEGSKVIREVKTKAPTWKYGTIRGGCTIPHNGNLLRFFHSRRDDEFSSPRWRYYIGWMLMNPNPPFDVIKMCDEPLLSGSELDSLDPNEKAMCQHHKQNCVLPFGVVRQGDEFWLSVGINDCQCGIIKLKEFGI